MNSSKFTRGVTLVEVVVVSAALLLFVLGLVMVINTYRVTVRGTPYEVKAAYLAEEGIEAMKFLRDNSWTDNIAPLKGEDTYYLSFSSNTWQLSSTTQSYIDGRFDRIIKVAAVFRDSSSDVVTSGGTLDPNTKKVTVTLSWSDGTATDTQALATYITNIWSN